MSTLRFRLIPQVTPLIKSATKTRSRLAEDSALVARCLNGDSKAWRQLFDYCQPALVHAIRRANGIEAIDDDVVQEIAGRVWYQLIRHDGALLRRFDENRACRLTTFLRSIARNQVRAFFRSEKRRFQREVVASTPEVAQSDAAISAEIGELLATLTQREKQFLKWCTENPVESVFDGSKNGVYQLRHRLRKKIAAHFQ